MARRALPLGAALVALALVLAPLAAVALRATGASLTPADWAALRFTLTQALLSAALSCLLAVPLARALARRRFFGRGLYLSLLGAPFILPVIVAIAGLLAIFGRSGALNAGLGALGLPPVGIYGLQGVVLAHVFFNLPLAARLLLQGWQAVPAEHLRLAASLGARTFRLIEAPMLRERLPGAFLVIFLICLSSFAVALTLGGGPRATTLELAIYQALRFEFDLGKAALLALIQGGIALTALALARNLALSPLSAPGLGQAAPPAPAGAARWGDAAVLTLAGIFLAAPLAAVALRGVPHLASLPPSIWAAALRSLLVSLGAAALCLALALPLASRPGRLSEAAAALPLGVSALVIGTGLFLLTWRLIRPEAMALPATMGVDAMLALPFAHRALAPAWARVEADFGRLADQLGLAGLARWRLLLAPRLRPALGFAAGLAAALAMGDLGVIALFATSGQETLPLAMQRLMGAYRMDQAAAAGLVLVAAAFALFWAFDSWGRRAEA